MADSRLYTALSSPMMVVGEVVVVMGMVMKVVMVISDTMMMMMSWSSAMGETANPWSLQQSYVYPEAKPIQRGFVFCFKRRKALALREGIGTQSCHTPKTNAVVNSCLCTIDPKAEGPLEAYFQLSK